MQRCAIGQWVVGFVIGLVVVLFVGLPTGLSSTITLPSSPYFQAYFQRHWVAAANEQNEVISLIQRGKAHYDNGEFLAAAEALQLAEQGALSIEQKAQALALQSLAWQKLGDWTSAENTITRSLGLILTLSQSTPEQNRIQGQAFSARGQLQFSLGRVEQALESWTQAELSYRQAGADLAVLGSRINQAQSLQSLGFYRRAENLLAELEETLSVTEDSALKVQGLLSLGNVLRLGGEATRAREVLTAGLAIATQLNLPQEKSQALLSLGNTERVLAARAMSIEETAQREQHLLAARDYYAQAQSESRVPVIQVQAKLNELSLLVDSEQLSLAAEVQRQIGPLVSALPPGRETVYAQVNLAQQLIDIAPEQSADIAQSLSTAIQQARTLQDKRAESYALGTLGHLYERVGSSPALKQEAIQSTASALSIAQTIRAPDIAYRWQWQMGRLLSKNAVERDTNTTAKNVRDEHSNTEAVEYYTAAVKTLNELRSDIVVLNPDVQFSFRDQVEPVYRELVDLLLSGDSPDESSLQQAREVLEALQLAELDNFFRDACAQPDAITIDEIDSTAAVVYPIVLKDRLAVILKLPGSDELFYRETPGVGEQVINEVVASLSEKLKRRSTLPAAVNVEAEQLYNWLLADCYEALDGGGERSQSKVKTLVFVLDGALRNVPMGVLYDGDRYLVERYAIALTPGLQLLDPMALERENLRVLLAGAVDAPSFEEAGFSSLENVAVELAEVQAQVSRSVRLQGDEFLQGEVRSLLESNRFDVVHLATHGNFSSNPEQTFLLDWEGRISANDMDTLFQASDPSQRSAVELLVLSACETAAGDNRAALGLAGIAIRAEVRSTLATLWQVNDASIAAFMIRFYEELSSGAVTKAEAVRNVQLAFLREYPNTDYARPFHWAPFTLVGNWL